jgi:hypothetical protein
MASLRSMILDDRISILATQTSRAAWERGDLRMVEQIAERDMKMIDLAKTTLRDRGTILVNAQSVWNYLLKENGGAPLAQIAMADFSSVPCPKPPYRNMWLETSHDGKRVGILTHRIELGELRGGINALNLHGVQTEEVQQCLEKDAPASLVNGLVWQETQGTGRYGGSLLYWLDANGNFQSSFRFHLAAGSTQEEIFHQQRMRCYELWTLHTFARLNCHNVELVPVESGVPKPNGKRKFHPPFSVWHEIVVKKSSQFTNQKTATPPAGDGEHREIRFHKIRGHYADYTKGKGLFGRWKVRIWVEEHTAGDPELGTVVASYKVE